MQTQANVTPLFEDNAAPTPSSSTSQPRLTVVPDDALVHTIASGESLYVIARKYDVTTDAIVQANSLPSPDQIFVGQQLIIPGRADQVASRQSQPSDSATDDVTTGAVNPTASATPTASASAPQGSAPAEQQVANVSAPAPASFRWPVQGRVIVDFASSQETGINIEAPEGSAVRSAEGGTVIYVGNGVEGYGNLVLIRHANGYVSAYAHLKDVTVAKDDSVQRGDTIGAIGMSGSVNRPQLHFELRQGAAPVDPMPLLAG